MILDEALQIPTIDIMNKIFTPEELRSFEEKQHQQLEQLQNQLKRENESDEGGEGGGEDENAGHVSFNSTSSPSPMEVDDDDATDDPHADGGENTNSNTNSNNAFKQAKKLRRHSEKLLSRKKGVGRVNTAEARKGEPKKEETNWIIGEEDKKVQFSATASSSNSATVAASASASASVGLTTSSPTNTTSGSHESMSPRSTNIDRKSKQETSGLKLSLENLSNSGIEFLTDVSEFGHGVLNTEILSPRKLRPSLTNDLFKCWYFSPAIFFPVNFSAVKKKM